MTVRVYLADDFTLAYKPRLKGARWRGGFKSLGEICRDAAKATGSDCFEIDFVSRRT